MRKYSFAFLVVTILILPLSLRACDDDAIELPGTGIVHFKDGLTPTSPIELGYGTGDNEGYSPSFYFRDYGPARIVEPPAPVIQNSKRSGS
jgi:hypothetical protein